MTLLSALTAHLPVLVAQGQPGEDGRPSGGHPPTGAAERAGAGLEPREWPGCLWALWVGAEPELGGGVATAQDPSPMDGSTSQP